MKTFLSFLVFLGFIVTLLFLQNYRHDFARDAVVAERAAIESAFAAQYTACRDVHGSSSPQCDAIADTYFAVRRDWNRRDLSLPEE